jgi:hypothetical protein
MVPGNPIGWARGLAQALAVRLGPLRRVVVELEQVVGGVDWGPFGAGAREASAYEAVDAPEPC